MHYLLDACAMTLSKNMTMFLPPVEAGGSSGGSLLFGGGGPGIARRDVDSSSVLA
jgi:hypothetical protein